MNRVASCFAALAASLCVIVFCTTQSANSQAVSAQPDALRAAVDAPFRAQTAVARDAARHPYEMLQFFGLKPTMTVIEILPGAAGYWTDMLAPYLQAQGRYVAALDPDGPEARGNDAFRAKLAAAPALFGKVETVSFSVARDALEKAPQADMVLTFRNMHNWMAAGTADAVFRALFAALKPGGVLGIEEHRGRTDGTQDPRAKSGYVRQDYAIDTITRAGFRFEGASEVNANPKDTKDYPAGVWTLPPTYRLGDTDRERYRAIGESDRFTLKFRKPE